MIALDTNVLVRVVTRDDPEQVPRAAEVLRQDRLWVAKTVVLETEWVLRHAYKLSRQAILETLQALLGYRNLRFEDRAVIVRALDGYAVGLDFADALHLASSGGSERFATFDQGLAKSAKALEGTPPVLLL